MKLRRIHRLTGLVMAPFFLITAVTGGVLLWRKQIGPRRAHEILDFHNYEIVAPYVGVIVAVGLVFMALTGLGIWWDLLRRRLRKRS